MIQELIEVHEKFLYRLKEATVNSRYKLSQVFLEFRESFLIYGDYCANMTFSNDLLRDVTKRNPLVDQLVQVSFSVDFDDDQLLIKNFCISKILAMPKRAQLWTSSVARYFVSSNAANIKISSIIR